jgi:hypothetical protein
VLIKWVKSERSVISVQYMHVTLLVILSVFILLLGKAFGQELAFFFFSFDSQFNVACLRRLHLLMANAHQKENILITKEKEKKV